MSASNLGFVIIWAKDVVATVKFYEQALGLTKRFVVETPDGAYAEFGPPSDTAMNESGITVLAISSMREASRLFPQLNVADGDRQGINPVQLRFMFKDVEAVYRAALEAGATPVTEPETQPWGTVLARFRDPNGVLVSLMTPLTPREEMLRLHEVMGSATEAILREPSKANDVLSANAPFSVSGEGDKEVLKNLLDQLSDEQLADMFGGSVALDHSEAAIVARL